MPLSRRTQPHRPTRPGIIMAIAGALLVLSVTTGADAAPPTISKISGQTTAEDTPLTVNFTVGPPPGADETTVTATSSDNTLVTTAFLVVRGTGTGRSLTLTPLANAFGTTTITLSATNTDGTTDESFLLTVTAVNDAPTISSISNQATAEDTAVGPLAFTVDDVDTAAGALSLTRASSNTTLVPLTGIVFAGSGANRTVTVVPAANQSGTATITLTVSDGLLSSATTFLFTVTSVNDPPTMSPIASLATAEDTPTPPIAFTVDDVETAAGLLVVGAASSDQAVVPDAGLVLGGSAAARRIQVQPAPNATGETTISVTVSDGIATSVQTFVLTVTPINDPPTIAPIAPATTAEDTPIDVAALVGDIDTPLASVTLSATSGNQALLPSTGLTVQGTGASRVLRLTPAANASGTATVTATVRDDAGAQAQVSFELTVTQANDPPTLTPISPVTISEDGTSGPIAFTIGDVDGAVSDLVVTTATSNPTLVPPAGLVVGGSGAARTVTVTPAPNQTGAVTVTVTVRDLAGDEAAGTFDVTVTSVNDPPTISPLAAQTITEDQATAALSFTIDDVDGPVDTLTLSASASNADLVPLSGIVFAGTGAGRTVTVTPAADQAGAATVTVTVSDGAATASTSFVLTVTATNDPPTVTALGPQSVPEDGTAGPIAFAVSDVDDPADQLTVSATSSNTALVPDTAIVLGGTGASRSITLTPRSNATGQTTVVVTGRDQAGAVGSMTFVLTVTPVNDPPSIATIANQRTAEDTPTQAIAVAVADVDDDAASLLVTVTALNTALVPSTGLVVGGAGARRTLTITPAQNQNGTSQITVAVRDAAGSQASISFTLTVDAVNDAPTIIPIARQSIAEDTSLDPLTITLSDADDDVAGLTFTAAADDAVLLPSGSLVVGGSGASRTLKATPAANRNGSSSITLTVGDGKASGTASFILEVTAVADAPTITSIPNQQTTEGAPTSPIPFTIGDPDTPDAPATGLTISAVSTNTTLLPPANIVFGGTGPARTITLTPAANTPGSAQVTVTVSDGALASSTSFTLTVDAVNDAPTISTIGPRTVAEDSTLGPLAFTIGDIDNPASTLTVTAISADTGLVPPAGIVLGGTGASRTIVITPAPNRSGSTTITVSVSDGSATTTSPFTLTVTPVNDPPTLTAIAAQVTDEDTALDAVAFTIDDVDNDPATQLVVSATSTNEALVPGANLTPGGTGRARSLRIVPAANANGIVTVTVTVSDGQASTSTAFQLTVKAVNDVPTISAIPDQTTTEDAATGAIAFTVGDVETAPASLDVTAASSSPTLVAQAGVVVGGAGASRTITITPRADATGDATITITVDDGTTTATRSFALRVTAVNDAPTISPFTGQTVDEDQATPAQSFTIDDKDSPVDVLTVSATSSNATLVPVANITLGGSGASRTVTVKPAPNETGTASITVIVGDGTNTSSAAFQVTVKRVNDPPTLDPIADQSVDEDTPTPAVALTVADVDDDVATLLLTATSSNTALVPPSGVVIGGTGATRTIRLTPAANVSGVTTIVITVRDAAGMTASRSFALAVRAVNDPPAVAPIADQTTPEDTPTRAIAITVSDAESNATSLAVTAESLDAALVPNGETGLALGGTGGTRTLVITPAVNQAGTTTIRVHAQDPDGGRATVSFTVTVTAANDGPVISTVGPQAMAEDTSSGPIAFTVDDVDTPVSALTVSAASSNAGVVPVSGIALGGTEGSRTVVLTPATNASGTATITLKVSDGQAERSTTFVTTVNPVNDPPTISPIPFQQTPEDTPTAPIAFTISDVDAPAVNPAQGLTLTGASADQSLVPNGAIVFGGSGTQRTVTVIPELGRNGTTIVTVTVRDDGGLASSTPFAVTVTDVPCAYTLTQGQLSMTAPGGSAAVGVSARQSCGWTVSSSVPWLTVTAPLVFPAFGNGGVAFSVAANAGPPRTGRVSIGGATLTVEQAGLTCAYGASATPAAFPSQGGAGNIVVTTTQGCPWSATTADSWITVGAPTGNTATFSVAPNTSPQLRSGTLLAGGVSVAIVQSGAATTNDADGDGLLDTWEQQFGLSADAIDADGGPAGDPDQDGVTNLEEARRGTHPRGFHTRLLAEGANSGFFSTLIALANPDPQQPARVLLRLLQPDGTVASQFVVVPPQSRRTVESGSVPGLGQTAFSTTIESDVQVVVDRTMSWDATGYGAHSESSIAAPRTRWYFAEGATHSGFDLFYLLQNPSLTDTATVQVTYLRPFPLSPLAKTYELKPGTRNNIWVDVEEFPADGSGDLALANTDVSAVIEVLSGPPIAAERAMYLSRANQLFVAGHDSAAIPEPSTDWFLAEGSTEGFFDEFVLVANPNPVAALIRATYLLPGGGTVEQDYTVAPNSRFTIWLNAEEIPRGSGNWPLGNTAVSTVIRSLEGVPVIVERAMWWPRPATQWTEAHNAAGTTTTGTLWAMAEGEARGPRRAKTYILIANPSPQEAKVRVRLLFEDGTTAPREFAVQANSRFNVDVDADFASAFAVSPAALRRFGATIESLPAGTSGPAPIVVERAMYWDSEGVFWAAGSNATATRLR